MLWARQYIKVQRMTCNCRDKPSRRRRNQKVQNPSEQYPTSTPAKDHTELRWTGQEGYLWTNEWAQDQRGPMVVTMQTRQAAWPNVSPETEDLVNASEQVQELVRSTVEATQEYLIEWQRELAQLYSQTARDPVTVLVELANSVQEASEQLGEFRRDALEYQQQQIGDLMTRIEEQDDELAPGGKVS